MLIQFLALVLRTVIPELIVLGVSTLNSFMRNWSLKSVLETACWKFNSVVASFYLKDFQFIF